MLFPELGEDNFFHFIKLPALEEAGQKDYLAIAVNDYIACHA